VVVAEGKDKMRNYNRCDFEELGREMTVAQQGICSLSMKRAREEPESSSCGSSTFMHYCQRPARSCAVAHVSNNHAVVDVTCHDETHPVSATCLWPKEGEVWRIAALSDQLKKDTGICQGRESVTEGRQNIIDFKHGAIKAKEGCQESKVNVPLPFW
jgi:hypothetical protein